MTIAVKICGLRTSEAVDAAAVHGASYVGFIFFPRSPRMVTPELAANLRKPVPKHVRVVAVTVDATDEQLDRIVKLVAPDMLQLHGRETPARTGVLRRRYDRPVIKAIPVANQADLASVPAFSDVADMFLFDAKPNPGDALPGGNARAFEWSVMKDAKITKPWLLAGGLTVETLPQALAESGAKAVDVSSGVERAPGEKDVDLIRRFLEAAKAQT